MSDIDEFGGDEYFAEWMARIQERIATKNTAGDFQVVMQFSISQWEQKKIDAWMDEHQAGLDCPLKKNLCPLTGQPFYMGAIGGGLTYSFTPTPVGVALKATCSCGASVDATDYESW